MSEINFTGGGERWEYREKPEHGGYIWSDI